MSDVHRWEISSFGGMRPDADGPYILASDLPKIRADAVREFADWAAMEMPYGALLRQVFLDYADQLEKEGTE